MSRRKVKLILGSRYADVTVVGVLDDVWGERVVAVLRLVDPANAPTAEELQEYWRAQLQFKIVELLNDGAYAAL
jgi:acyl-CoA synthetase (AMP-forming)/AMP-acid ligase II